MGGVEYRDHGIADHLSGSGIADKRKYKLSSRFTVRVRDIGRDDLSSASKNRISGGVVRLVNRLNRIDRIV